MYSPGRSGRLHIDRDSKNMHPKDAKQQLEGRVATPKNAKTCIKVCNVRFLSCLFLGFSICVPGHCLVSLGCVFCILVVLQSARSIWEDTHVNANNRNPDMSWCAASQGEGEEGEGQTSEEFARGILALRVIVDSSQYFGKGGFMVNASH